MSTQNRREKKTEERVNEFKSPRDAEENRRRRNKKEGPIKPETWSERRPPYAQPDLILSGILNRNSLEPKRFEPKWLEPKWLRGTKAK